MDGVFGDASEDVGQVGLRVDAVHLCCFDDGVDAGGALASGVGPTKKIILPALAGFRGGAGSVTQPGRR